jgi:long-chain acyl-CoA synthetase
MSDANTDRSLGELFYSTSGRWPERVFIRRFNQPLLTYGAARNVVARQIRAMHAMGLRPGSRIVCYTEDRVTMALVLTACAIAGIIPIALSPRFSIAYLERLALVAETMHVLVDDPKLADSLKSTQLQCVPVVALDGVDSGEDLAPDFAASTQGVLLVQPTAGSTGTPRLVVREHRSILRYAEHIGAELGPAPEEPERFLSVAALTHAFGVHMFGLGLSRGAEFVLPTGLDTSASASEVQALQPDVVPVTPRVLRSLMLQAGADSSPLGPRAKILLTAGGLSDVATLSKLQQAGMAIMEFYGSSEASLIALTPRGRWKPGFAGVVAKDAVVRIAPDGEILVRSPGLLRGYLGGEVTASSFYSADGFYRTGDLGDIVDDYIRIRGRKSNVFCTPEGSYIYVERVETALEGIPGVVHAILIGDGMPHLSALIVLEPAAERSDEPDGFLDENKFAKRYAEFGTAIKALNKAHERIERVGGVMLFDRRFDERAVKVVAAGKLRKDRALVNKLYGARIQSLYEARALHAAGLSGYCLALDTGEQLTLDASQRFVSKQVMFGRSAAHPVIGKGE